MDIVINKFFSLNNICNVLESNNFIVYESNEYSSYFKGRGIFHILFLSMIDSFNTIQSGSVKIHDDIIKIKVNVNVFMIATTILVSMFNTVVLVNMDGPVNGMVLLVQFFSYLLIPYSYFFTRYLIRNKIIRLLEKGRKTE